MVLPNFILRHMYRHMYTTIVMKQMESVFFLISPKEIRIEQLKFEDTLSILQDAGTNVWLDHVGSFQEHPGVRDLARTSEASEFLVTVVQRLSLFFLGGCHIN